MNSITALSTRTTMNGKPVLHVPVSTVLNLESGFQHKLLCDGPALALGDGCAFSCAFCYVPAVYQKLDRIRVALATFNETHGTALKHEDVVILREGAIEVLRAQLVDRKGRPKYKDDPNDRRVVYSSPADDVAANMDLVRATAAAVALILELTTWHVRLLSKSNLLPNVASLLYESANRDGPGKPYRVEDVHERVIFGFSTGTIHDGLARVFEKGTPLVSKRIEALRMMQDNNFRTFGMVCPSLPRYPGSYGRWAADVAGMLRPEKLEHVWAEVINLRGESFKRTWDALRAGGFVAEAEMIDKVSHDAEAWENYDRATFLGHAEVYDQWIGKLRFLTYVKPYTLSWWQKQIGRGAVLLGEAAHVR